MSQWVLNWPQKQLKMNKCGSMTAASTAAVALTILLASVVFAWLALSQSKSIAADYQTSKNYTYVESARVNGSCKRRLVLVDCDVTIHHGGRTIEKELFFIGLGGGYETAVDVAFNPLRGAVRNTAARLNRGGMP